MRFNYNTNAYKNYLIASSTNRCTAILDTGASMTVIDLYTLSRLVNKKAEELKIQAESLISRGIINVTNVRTASGHENRVIPVKVHNFILSDEQFDIFYMHLNIDKKEDREGYSNIILIGLDIIRAGKIQGDADHIEITGFDYEKYKNNFIEIYGNTFNIFQISDESISNIGIERE